jgi:hypothetical protein
MAKKQRADDAQVKSERRGSDRVLEPTLANLDALSSDAVVVGLCSDVRPLAGLLGVIDWRLCGRVSRLVQRGVITGARGEQVLMPTFGRITAPRLFVVGWGHSSTTIEQADERLQATLAMIDKAGVQRIAFAFPEPASELLSLVDVVEQGLGTRLVAAFGADPLPVR